MEQGGAVIRGRPIPQSVKKEVRLRAGDRCEVQYGSTCLRAGPDFDFHHRKSRARGGSNESKNLVYACRPCHDAIEGHAPGTGRWRSHSWQTEDATEEDWGREVGRTGGGTSL